MKSWGLWGGSGSGKSVLLRSILGLNTPQAGEVRIEGVDISTLSVDERIVLQRKWGVLFQNGALFSGMSVLDNIALPLREHTTLPKKTIEELALFKLEMVGLDADVADKMPSALSGGMATQAKLALLGITGMVYMELTTEPTDTEPVRFVAGERYPVIQGSGTQLAKLFEDIPQITEQVMEISEKLNGLLNEENMASLDATLINIEKITRDMNGLLNAENVSNASIMLANFFESSEDVKVMIERFEKTANEIDQAVNASAVVTKNEASISKFTQEGLDQITAMTREIRKMAESIRETSDSLNEDPSQILYQPTYRGVEIAK